MDSRTKKTVNAVILGLTGVLVLGVIYWVGSAMSGTNPPPPAIGGGAGGDVPAPKTVEGGPPTPVPPVNNNGGGGAVAVVENPPKIPDPTPPVAALKVPTVVYTNALDTPPGEEWSDNHIAEAPSDKRKYLGDFKTEQVTLSLANLPPHKLLTVKFDLLTMRSWDGSSKSYHETFWDLSVTKGPNLIHTTIGNCGFFSDNNEQAFPDTWPCGPNPAWTGSLEHQTLGVFQDWGGPDRTFDCSSVYRLSLTFPHVDGKVTFRFKGTPTGSINKPWGLAHVEVVAVPDFTPATDEQLKGQWAALGSSDPMEAYRAHWDLVAEGDVATVYIAKQLKNEIAATVLTPSTDDIAALAKNLYSDNEATFAAAMSALSTRGAVALPIVQKVFTDPALSPTNKTRMRTLISRLNSAANGNVKESLADLKLHRARHLLQVIHSDDALALVDMIKPHEGDDGLYQPPTGKAAPAGQPPPAPGPVLP